MQHRPRFRRRLSVLVGLAMLFALGLATSGADGGWIQKCPPVATITSTVQSTTTLISTVVSTVTSTVTGPTTTVTNTVTTTAPGTTTPQPTALFSGDFETGDFSQFGNTYCYMAWSCAVVPAPGGHSGYAGRLETRYHDFNAYNGNPSTRAQLQGKTSERSGDESWWHWELYLPADWTPSGGGWGDSVFEWHHFSTVGDGLCRCPSSPPFTLGIYQGRLITRIVKSNDEAQGIYWDQYDLGPATAGAWTTYDLHVKWSTDPAVAVEDISINGVPKQHITGHPNEFVGYFNYVLFGVYHEDTPPTVVQYYDNVRRMSGP